jgi:hypothetical protein
MKEKFDAYLLWPLTKKIQNWIVDRSTARDFTVNKMHAKKTFKLIIFHLKLIVLISEPVNKAIVY